MKRNDILWKAALEDLFDDFLRFFYPDADELFDLEKGFDYLDKELEQLFPPEADNFTPRYVDKLVKVFTRKGGEEWILIHIEVQGYSENDFPKRMFQYYYRILDKYDKPITAFAILTDPNKNFHPHKYEAEFLGTGVCYWYNTYKITDQENEFLDTSDNPFAMVVLAAKLVLDGEKKNDAQLFDNAFYLAKRLLDKQISKDKIRKVINFLRFYLRFENPQMFTKFEQQLSVLTENDTTMGIEEFLLDRAKKEGVQIGREKGLVEGIEKGREEGIERGREEGIKETALKMKKSGLSIQLIADITGLSIFEINRLD
jgi:hypothetical protein